MISKSKYRTIFKGFDNETGFEIAWSVYSLSNITTGITIKNYFFIRYV